MSSKRKLIIILILFSILLLLNSISAFEIDSSDWKNITIENTSFKIPPKYNDGKLSENCYMIKNPYTFRLMDLNFGNLVSNYGWDITDDDLKYYESKNIGNHDCVVIYSKPKVVNHSVTSIYFSSDQNMFVLSYKGDEVTPEIEEIIKSSPKSKLENVTFFGMLQSALNEYLIKRQNEIDRYNSYQDSKAIRDTIYYTSPSYGNRYSDGFFYSGGYGYGYGGQQYYNSY